MAIEYILNLWNNYILPTFVNIISVFTTPINKLISQNLKDIPVIGWLLSLLTEIFPQNTLIELMLGSAIIFTISITIIKFIVGLVK